MLAVSGHHTHMVTFVVEMRETPFDGFFRIGAIFPDQLAPVCQDRPGEFGGISYICVDGGVLIHNTKEGDPYQKRVVENMEIPVNFMIYEAEMGFDRYVF